MAQTESNVLNLDFKAPNFSLLDVSTNTFKDYDAIAGHKGTIIMFICNHCPFVHHVLDEIVKISADYRVQGIGFVAISSNDVVKYPQDSPEKMIDFAFKNKLDFPYLFDENQEIAQNYHAACTPDFYLFDAEKKLYYHGQLDDSRPANGVVLSGSDLRNAIDALLYNRKLNPVQKPSIGCGIKWK
jgi:thiol-disulfide isomerase/thioredoxin